MSIILGILTDLEMMTQAISVNVEAMISGTIIGVIAINALNVVRAVSFLRYFVRCFNYVKNKLTKNKKLLVSEDYKTTRIRNVTLKKDGTLSADDIVIETKKTTVLARRETACKKEI